MSLKIFNALSLLAAILVHKEEIGIIERLATVKPAYSLPSYVQMELRRCFYSRATHFYCLLIFFFFLLDLPEKRLVLSKCFKCLLFYSPNFLTEGRKRVEKDYIILIFCFHCSSSHSVVSNPIVVTQIKVAEVLTEGHWTYSKVLFIFSHSVTFAEISCVSNVNSCNRTI